MTTTMDQVKEIIVKKLGVDPEKVLPNARLIDDLGADSLDSVEFIMEFEETFEIEIPEEEMEKLSTVQEAVDFIEKQKNLLVH